MGIRSAEWGHPQENAHPDDPASSPHETCGPLSPADVAVLPTASLAVAARELASVREALSKLTKREKEVKALLLAQFPEEPGTYAVTFEDADGTVSVRLSVSRKVTYDHAAINELCSENLGDVGAFDFLVPEPVRWHIDMGKLDAYPKAKVRTAFKDAVTVGPGTARLTVTQDGKP